MPALATPRGFCREAHPEAVIASRKQPPSSDWEVSRTLDGTRSEMSDTQDRSPTPVRAPPFEVSAQCPALATLVCQNQ
jgi:hypothetical protein